MQKILIIYQMATTLNRRSLSMHLFLCSPGTMLQCNYTCNEDECNTQHAKMLILNDETKQISNYLANLPKNTLLKDLLREVESIKFFLHSVRWVFEDLHQKLLENIHCVAVFVTGFITVLVIIPKVFSSLVVPQGLRK